MRSADCHNELNGAEMFAGDHVPNFPLKHAQKDMRLACALGRQVIATDCP